MAWSLRTKEDVYVLLLHTEGIHSHTLLIYPAKPEHGIEKGNVLKGTEYKFIVCS